MLGSENGDGIRMKEALKEMRKKQKKIKLFEQLSLFLPEQNFMSGFKMLILIFN